MVVALKRIISQTYLKCEQVLNSFKTGWIQFCSQGAYRKKGLKYDLSISAHSLSLEFKSFYRVWITFKRQENTSPILTTLPHHTDLVKWSELER